MRNWIGFGLILCFGLIGVMAADVSASSRSLSLSELTKVRGGATQANLCCVDDPGCLTAPALCKDALPGEMPPMPESSWCSARKEIAQVGNTKKACGIPMNIGKTCTYSTVPSICLFTYQCRWDVPMSKCVVNNGGAVNTVNVPSTCTDDCP